MRASKQNCRLRQHEDTLMPVGVKITLYSVVGALVAGAIYLFSVRGTGILLDLASVIGQYCF